MDKCIWILDDDINICEALEIILNDKSYKVRRFEYGAKLLKELKESIPDMLIMDVLLTKESGIQIAKNIRKTDRYKNIPILIMSANYVEDIRLKQTKAIGFLRKPFDMYELIEIVEKYI